MNAKIVEFLSSPDQGSSIPPGGPLLQAGEHVKDGELYLVEVARMLKRLEEKMVRIRRIHHKIDQITKQRHFDAETDTAIVDRLCKWVAELIAAP